MPKLSLKIMGISKLDFKLSWDGKRADRVWGWKKKVAPGGNRTSQKIKEHQFSKKVSKKSFFSPSGFHQKNFEEKSLFFHEERSKMRKIIKSTQIGFLPKLFAILKNSK